MTSKTSKYACVFTDCNRVFDRYSRLEAHFRAHINNNTIRRTQYRTPVSNQPRKRGKSSVPQKRRGQNKKHRSSNLRSHPFLNRNNGPTLIDLRTPSLSPDSPSEMEVETEVEDIQTPDIPITPSSSTRKGPTWAVAPRSPSPTHFPSHGHQTDERDAPDTPAQLPGHATQEIAQVVVQQVALKENDIPTKGDLITDPSQMNNPNPSTFDSDTEQAENGDTDQAENATVFQPLSTPQKDPQTTSNIISPFLNLSSCMCKLQPIDLNTSKIHIDHIENIEPRTKIIRTPSPHPDDENNCTPNSLDRFVRDAMASIGKGRERSETPCPPPKGSSVITTNNKSNDYDDETELPSIIQAETLLSHTMPKSSFQPMTPQSRVTTYDIPIQGENGSTPTPTRSVDEEDINPFLIITDSAVTQQPHEASHSNTLEIPSTGNLPEISPPITQKAAPDISLTVRKLSQLLVELKEDEEMKRRKLDELEKLIEVLSEAQSCVLI